MYNLTNAAMGGNLTLSRAGGATANISALAAATTYTIQNVTYSVQGKMFFKATAAGAATPTTDVNTTVAFLGLAANKACAYMWALNAAGTVQLAQGPIVAYTDTSANSTRTPLPSLPDTSTPLGYIVVKAGATAVGNWLPGANNFTGVTGITVDPYVDTLGLLAADPLTA